MDRQPIMIDAELGVFQAGEKLSHIRAQITELAREMSRALAQGALPCTDTLALLNAYLAAENASKLELALTLELQTIEKGEAYEISCN